MTNFRSTLSFALLALAPLAASPAMAAPATQFTATLKAPLAQPRQAIIDGQMWNCAGATCTAPDDGQRAVATCGQVVRKFGELTAFASAARAMTADQLARCNTGR